MLRKWTLLALLAALFLPAGSAFAMDPSSAQAYCNAVKQAAMTAQSNYIKTFTPAQDPQQVFDDSVSSCMSNIANFTVPSVDPWIAAMDNILQKMAQKFLLQACNAARQKFQSIVSDAQQTVNNATQGANDLGIESGLGGLGSTSYGVGVNQSGNATVTNGSGRVIVTQ